MRNRDRASLGGGAGGGQGKEVAAIKLSLTGRMRFVSLSGGGGEKRILLEPPVCSSPSLEIFYSLQHSLTSTIFLSLSLSFRFFSPA